MVPLLLAPALAILATLVYASWLDVQDRRVPFRTWYPMLVILLPTSVVFFGSSLQFPARLQYFALSILILAVATTLLLMDYAWTRYRQREDPTRKEIMMQGFYWLLIAIPLATVLYGFMTGVVPVLSLVALAFCVLVYLFGLCLYGGADTFALLAIGVGLPLFPILPLAGYPPVPYLPWTALLNALILNLAAPIGIFALNRYRSNDAPLRYQFLGFPVKGDEIQDAYGFVMEVIEDHDGIIQRRFLSLREILGSIFAKGSRIYTKDLRQHPERFQEELGRYRKAGTVWISYGVPFLLPVTAGFISAIFIGDILYMAIQLVAGL